MEVVEIFSEKTCRLVLADVPVHLVRSTLEVLMTSNPDPPVLKKRFLLSIQGKLILLLAILIIPNLFILTYMCYDRFQSRRVEELQANLELARAVSMNFETFFQDILIDELLIGTALTSSQPLLNQDQNRILAKARTMRSTFRQLFWVNPAGRILAATDPESIGTDLTERSYFQEIPAGRDIVVSDLILSKKTGSPTFTISRGIRNEGGDLIGIVIAEIAPDELKGVLGIQRSLDASVSILDSKGMLVYRYPVTNYTWEQRNRLAQVPVLEDALKSKEIVTKVTAVTTGKPQLAAFAPIPSIGWVSEASRAEDVVMDAVTFKLLPQAGMRIFVTFIAFGIALVVPAENIHFYRKTSGPCTGDSVEERARLQWLCPAPSNWMTLPMLSIKWPRIFSHANGSRNRPNRRCARAKQDSGRSLTWCHS